MPAYQYKCPICDKPVEIVKPMSESDREELCGDDCVGVLQRDYSNENANFQLKGSGWTRKIKPRN
jgi:putative FmdB family regulatory protein